MCNGKTNKTHFFFGYGEFLSCVYFVSHKFFHKSDYRSSRAQILGLMYRDSELELGIRYKVKCHCIFYLSQSKQGFSLYKRDHLVFYIIILSV